MKKILKKTFVFSSAVALMVTMLFALPGSIFGNAGLVLTASAQENVYEITSSDELYSTYTSGSTIKLMNDVSCSESTHLMISGKNLVFDLNEHTLTLMRSVDLENGANVTFKNGIVKTIDNGVCYMAGFGGSVFTLENNSTLKLENIAVLSGYQAQKSGNDAIHLENSFLEAENAFIKGATTGTSACVAGSALYFDAESTVTVTNTTLARGDGGSYQSPRKPTSTYSGSTGTIITNGETNEQVDIPTYNSEAENVPLVIGSGYHYNGCTGVYDREIAVEKNLIAISADGKSATYHKTCACGQKGLATFSTGEVTDTGDKFDIKDGSELYDNYSSGATLTLTNDIAGDHALTVSGIKRIYDLNGHTFTIPAIILLANADVTFKNGILKTPDSPTADVITANSSKVILENIAVLSGDAVGSNAGHDAVHLTGTSQLTAKKAFIKGGSVTAENPKTLVPGAALYFENTASVNVTDTTLALGDGGDYYTNLSPISVFGSATTVIDGAKGTAITVPTYKSEAQNLPLVIGDGYHYNNCDGLYDNEVIADKYKVSDITCRNYAVYYYSCDCGQKGTKTFEDESGTLLTCDYYVSGADESVHWLICKMCESGGSEKHSGGTATCKAKAVCTVCNQPYGSLGEHTDSDKDGKCDTCGTYMDGIGAKLAGYSLSLNGNIGVNFYMELSGAIASNENAYMEFTLPNTTGKTKVYVTGTHEDGTTATTDTVGDKTYYVFSCEVAAKEMTDEIQAQMIAGENRGTVYTYTVKDYADYILSHTETYGDTVVALVKAMLNYGAYSQTYFGYQTAKLANADLAEADKAPGDLIADQLSEKKATITKNEAVCTFASAYLTLQSETAVHVYVKLAGEVSEENVTFKIDNSEIAKENLVKGTGTYEGYYILSVDNIQASALDEMHTFSVTAGDQTASLIYGPMSYCYSILAGESASDDLKNVVKALCAFNLAADRYVAN